MATSAQTNVIVFSPCELYRRAWESLLASQEFVDSVQTAATVSDISLPIGDRNPTTILVDAPGSEHQFALQLGCFYKRCHAFFMVNDYDLVTILPLLELGVTGFAARSDSISKFVQTFLASAKGQIGLPPDDVKRAMIELAYIVAWKPSLMLINTD